MKIKVYSKISKQTEYMSVEGFKKFCFLWEKKDETKANELYESVINGGKIENNGGIITACDWME